MIEILGTALNQWDIRRSVQVTEIEADHVHFANKGDSRAVIMGIVDSQAKIPDYLLQTGKQLCVYAVKNGVTVESKIFYVKTRERPEEYVYEEDQRNYIYELITDAQTAIDGANDAAAAATERTNAAVGDVNTAIDNLNNVTNAAVKNANTAASSAITATTKANVAANSADLAAKIANDAAEYANHTAKSLMVIGSGKGNSIYLDDAIDQFLVGMRIFGKTTQNGVPTPDAPVDLVSAGDGGSLNLFVTGKNLFTGYIVGGINPADGSDYAVTTQRRTAYLPISAPGQKYSISGIPNTLYNMVAFYDADKSYISRTTGGASGGRLVEPPASAKYFRFSIYETSGVTGKIAEADSMASITMIEAGATATAYEAGKQIFSTTVSTPNGLPGIPVSSGGNYTDANGQQWVCDEIDFARGVYIRRVAIVTFTGTENWVNGYKADTGQNRFELSTSLYGVPGANIYVPAKCNTFQYEETMAIPATNHFRALISNGMCYIVFNPQTDIIPLENVSAWKTWLAQNPTTLVIPARTTTEITLSEEELAAYAALRTYRGNTTVSNDAGAWMDIEYVMDAKKYIDSQISAGILAATVE